MGSSSHAGVLLVASKGSPAAGEVGSAVPGAVLSFERDPRTGRLGGLLGRVNVPVPSYMAYDAMTSTVYITSDFSTLEEGQVGAGRTGQVTAAHLGREGQLRTLNGQVADDLVLCHVAVHQAGQHILTADFASGRVTAYPLLEDGSLCPASDIATNQGNGRHSALQAGPHAHMVRPVAGSRWVLTTDLGTDEVLLMTFDQVAGKLRRGAPSAQVASGSGPRHVAVWRDRMLLVVNELRPTVSVFSFDIESGAVASLGDVGTASGEAADEAVPSGIALSPDGRFVYVGNRGRNTVAVLRVTDGAVSFMSEVPAGGEPRDLLVAGPFLYVAHLASDKVCVFALDDVAGLRTVPLQVAQVPSPSCVLAVPFERCDHNAA
jgi:6-phosphogluconolactonase